MRKLLRLFFCSVLSGCALAGGAMGQTADGAASDGSPKKKQPVSVLFNVRGDWENNIQTPPDTSTLYKPGFALCYLNFVLNGNFTDKLSYHMRLRINRLNDPKNFLDAFDNLRLDYAVTPQWKVSVGKQMVYIGGYEYDYDPIHVYYWSLANYFITCYELGVMGSYTSADGKHTVVAQICNSPFQDHSHQFDGRLAYNLMWYGDFGVYKAIWSVNMAAYGFGKDFTPEMFGGAASSGKQKFVNFLALGNQFNFDPVRVEIDYHNRYFLGQGSFFKDFSVVGKLNVNVKEWANIMVKGGVDYNGTGTNDDRWVVGEDVYRWMGSPPGTARNLSGYIGAGVEFFPLTKQNSKDLRLHAYWMTDNRSGRFDQHYAALGVSWWFRAYERK